MRWGLFAIANVAGFITLVLSGVWIDNSLPIRAQRTSDTIPDYPQAWNVSRSECILRFSTYDRPDEVVAFYIAKGYKLAKGFEHHRLSDKEIKEWQHWGFEADPGNIFTSKYLLAVPQENGSWQVSISYSQCCEGLPG